MLHKAEEEAAEEAMTAVEVRKEKGAAEEEEIKTAAVAVAAVEAAAEAAAINEETAHQKEVVLVEENVHQETAAEEVALLQEGHQVILHAEDLQQWTLKKLGELQEKVVVHRMVVDVVHHHPVEAEVPQEEVVHLVAEAVVHEEDKV